jgi:hypothetical protein
MCAMLVAFLPWGIVAFIFDNLRDEK